MAAEDAHLASQTQGMAAAGGGGGGGPPSSSSSSSSSSSDGKRGKVEQLRILYYPEPGQFLTWKQQLRQEGILVRSMAGKPQLEGSLRVSIGTLTQMQKFWACYRQLDP